MKSLADRLWARVAVMGEDECWEWLGARQPSGHGVIRSGLGTTGAHRAAWESEAGPIPSGMFVLHRCDNPPCCNPRHLFLGTQADNLRDMWSKGRGRGGANPNPLRGEAHPNAKLTDRQRDDAVLRVELGESRRSVARSFGVNPTVIDRLIQRGWTPSQPR